MLPPPSDLAAYLADLASKVDALVDENTLLRQMVADLTAAIPAGSPPPLPPPPQAPIRVWNLHRGSAFSSRAAADEYASPDRVGVVEYTEGEVCVVHWLPTHS